jgi:putative effector of murein hydrolase LrgA (UPF0299 family)
MLIEQIFEVLVVCAIDQVCEMLVTGKGVDVLV